MLGASQWTPPVVATLIASVVAAVAAIFSAVVAARFATTRDRRSWRRDDRRPVLGEFLQRSDRVTRAAWSCFEGFDAYAGRKDLWTDDRAEFLEAYEALEAKLGEVRLSASEACAAAARGVERAAWAAVPFVELHPSLPTETLMDEFHRRMAAVEAAHDAFVAAAKRDLNE